MFQDEIKDAVGIIKKLKTTGSSPLPRNSMSIAALDKKIYIFGGMKEDFNTGDEFYNDLYCFDAQTKVWEKLSPKGTLPTPRSTAGAVSLKNKNEILVFGGTFFNKGYANLTMFDEIWSYSLNENQWTLRQPVNTSPGGRAKPSIWNVEDKMYIFGGITAKHQTLNDLWCYDDKTNTWTEIIPKNSPPPGRLEATGGTTPTKDGSLIIYAGESMDIAQGKSMTMLDDIWEYDLKNNEWRNITPKGNISIHNYACTGIIGDYLYVIGGDLKGMPGATKGFGAPFPQNVCNELWRFDLKKKKWEKIHAEGDAPPRIKQAGSIVVDEKLYIVGGYDFINIEDKGPGQIWNMDTYVYDPNFKLEV